MRVGVIDVGTNSVRALAADVSGGRVVADHLRSLVITRLGRGVDRTGRLGEEPIRRTVAAVAEAVAACRGAGAERIAVACTSAVRDAENRDEFFAAVRAETGIDARVLPGDEEAKLGFAGATMNLDAAAPYCVLDIGGGSTELVTGSGAAERWISVNIGSVRLTERHVRNDPPLPEELRAVAADADAEIERVRAAVDPASAATLVGLAGTITTAAAVLLGLDHYDREAVHGSRLSRGAVAGFCERLAGMTSAERRALPVMPEGREDVIVAGLVVLERVMQAFGFDAVLVSESDILDGLALAVAGA